MGCISRSETRGHPKLPCSAWSNFDGTLTPKLMAVNPESHCRTSKVATISHGPSVRQSYARWASGKGTDF